MDLYKGALSTKGIKQRRMARNLIAIEGVTIAPLRDKSSREKGCSFVEVVTKYPLRQRGHQKLWRFGKEGFGFLPVGDIGLSPTKENTI